MSTPSPSSFPVSPESARTWDVLSHVASLAGFIIPFGNILGPFVVWTMKKAEHPTVDAHGKEAMNFQISITAYILACIPLAFVLIGIPLMILLGLWSIVGTVLAAIKASNGQTYRYPLTFRLIS